jgi:hypothetical protein
MASIQDRRHAIRFIYFTSTYSSQAPDEIIIISMRADPEPSENVLLTFCIPVSKRTPVNADTDREDSVLLTHTFELQTPMARVSAP